MRGDTATPVVKARDELNFDEEEEDGMDESGDVTGEGSSVVDQRGQNMEV